MAVVTVLGVGKLPKAPGTWGTFAAIPLYFLPDSHRVDVLISFIVVFTLISIPIINRIEKAYGSDPSFIVIDEAIGMWIVLLSPLCYENYYWLFLGFLLFRIFDIIKPFPINKLNDKEGGFFVIADDILAAVFTLVLMHLLALLSSSFAT